MQYGHQLQKLDTGYMKVCSVCESRYDCDRKFVGKERALTLEICPKCVKKREIIKKTLASKVQLPFARRNLQREWSKSGSPAS